VPQAQRVTSVQRPKGLQEQLAPQERLEQQAMSALKVMMGPKAIKVELETPESQVRTQQQ